MNTNPITLTDAMLARERQLPKWGARHKYQVATLQLRTPLTDVPTEQDLTNHSIFRVELLQYGTTAIVNVAEPQHIVLRLSDLRGRSEVLYEGKVEGVLRVQLHANYGGIRFLTLQLQANSTLRTIILPPE